MTHEIRDLGELDHTVLVFGGAYSNLQATKAMQSTARDRGIESGNIICTGDVVAYCAQAEETTQLIREWGIHVVRGNCEESLGNDAEDCACGFEQGSACARLSVDWYEHAQRQLHRTSRQWMRALPGAITFQFGGLLFRCIHGGVKQTNEFVFYSSSAHEKQRQLVMIGADVIIAGHSGIPFGQRLDKGVWLNAGVIGMPANDSSQHTWYMMIEMKDEKKVISWHPLEYDVQAARQVMLDAGLPPDYREALATGLWPSLDVLPDAEKNATGQKLSLPSMELR